MTILKHKGELKEKATASDARNEETQIHSSKRSRIEVLTQCQCDPRAT